ncbi:MAG: diguanylate cyclase [Planctomycetota bacterium]|nr:diguanylate cyclase [Planctomycetota bacterium]
MLQTDSLTPTGTDSLPAVPVIYPPDQSDQEKNILQRCSDLNELLLTCGLDKTLPLEGTLVRSLAATSEAERQQLVQSRLGLAQGLFMALRCKHAETADHSLRVAILCSIWAANKGFSEAERQDIEIAALLHDIGKIGLAERILLKPAKLTDEEQIIVDRHRLMGIEILATFCGSLQVLETITHALAWFDGSRLATSTTGTNLPVAARMLAIADAYDSITSNQVYRSARSHDRAIMELYAGSGSQFDIQLIDEFSELHKSDQSKWRGEVSRHWLEDLNPREVNSYWKRVHQVATPASIAPELLFQRRLLENMYDGVIFVDANLQINLWNHGAERLTGIAGSNMCQRVFDPEVIKLHDERGMPLSMADCPVALAIRSGSQSARRLVLHHEKQRVIIDMQIVPVISAEGTVLGAAIILHDASGQVSLEERCQKLHEKAIRDPMTQLANRAEFDRMHAMFVDVHLERNTPCSLIITDIDRFKRVNDTFGHQAGDEAIKSYAQVLKSHCRPSDLAARYGGEEFVLLCTNCSNAMAAERAEEIRQAFAALTQPAMGGAQITASFGVTEVQRGDTPETMLRRADRALLTAKETGRNKVVQLGGGIDNDVTRERRKFRWWPWSSPESTLELRRTMVTAVPLRVAIEKLRGFVADHEAEIVNISGNALTLEILQAAPAARRTNDRPVPQIAELNFTEEHLTVGNSAGNITQRTKVDIVVRPKRGRDRRKDSGLESARQIMASLRAYLMATDYDPKEDANGKRRSIGSLLPRMNR